MLGLVAGGLAQLRTQTGMDSFLPADDPAARQFDEYAREFGGDPVVVLLESAQPRALLAPERLEALVRLEGELSRLPDVAVVHGPGTVLNQIAGRTQDLLAELSGRRDGERVRAEQRALDSGAGPAEATAAADAAAAAFDERYATLLAQGLPAGLPTLRNASFVSTVVFGQDGGAAAGGAPRPQWRFVVPSEKAVAVLVRPREGLDAAGAASLVAGVRQVAEGADLGAEITISGVPAVVAALSERTERSAPLLGALAVVAVAACFLLSPWARRRDRAVPVLTTVAAIAVVLSAYGWLGRPVSLGVVAFLPVVLGVGCYYPTYLLLGASRRTVLTVAAASALSFGTLLLSPLPLVRDLGTTLAAGVLLAAGAGLLARRGPPPEVGPEADPASARPAAPAVTALAALAVVAGIGWAMLPTIGLRTDVAQFADGLPAADQARHVEDVIGSSGEVAIVLRGIDTTSPAAFAWQQQATEAVVRHHGVLLRPVLSPPALMPFLGDEPTTEQIAAALRLVPPYLSGAVLSPDRSTAVLSFGMRLDELDRLAAIRDELLAGLPPAPVSYEVELVGLPVTALRGAELVSADRLAANVLGIVAAGAVLAVGLRRRADAVVAIASAALATGAGLFLMWLTGTDLTPITVALGSLTAAVGCEFAVVLAASARRPTGPSNLRVAVPLLTAASGIGYAVLLVSDLQVVREFGVQLAGAVVLSMLSAQLVLRVVRPRRVAPPGPVPIPARAGAEPSRTAATP
ncbi:RND transporter [Pseudonocardia sp. H11422]|uniref:RND transporter n=1 Tax=Pseudonocardia sp. H11422 TaxID=2835866 RepID=UPI001BDCC769|nr:RND transporter [Pseudonocardia sp. H11422]